MKKLTLLLAGFIAFSNLGFAQLIKQWDYRFGASAIDEFHDLILVNDPGTFDGKAYLLAGYSESAIGGDKTSANQGSGDFWLISLNSLGVKQWDKSYGGSNYDELFEAQQTSDGGYILGGWSNSGISGDKSQANFGAGDYWVVKTDVNGNKLWDKTYGGTFEDYLQSIKQTSDGGYILAGRSNSGISGTKTQANRGLLGTGWDYWIVKIDANGAVQWDKTFGGSDDDQLFSIQQTSDGGYILGGLSLSPISGEKSQASQGVDDYWIVKTDANGIMQWDKRFGGTNIDQLQTVIQTSDGGYLLAGGSASGANGDKSQASRGNFDYWIVKTSAAGVKQWDKRFGGTSADNLFDLIQTNDGGYLLGGASSSAAGGDKSQGNQGTAGSSYDYWLVKTDANGILQLDKRFGGTADDYAKAVIQNTDGSYVVGGWSTSGLNADKTQASQGSYDYWICKVSGSNSITTNAITSPECAGSSVSVSFTATGSFNSGNTFTAQLSDENGSFASPTIIGTLIGSTAGTINASLPFVSIASANYQIQVISDNPVSQDIYPSASFQINIPDAYYFDFDNDGFGAQGTPQFSCSAIAGWVTNNTDCNDNDGQVNTLPNGNDGAYALGSNCEGSSGNLFVCLPIMQATSYQWILSSGLSSSLPGNISPDTSISITIALGATYDSIGVAGKNSCGLSDTLYFSFFEAPLPSAAGAISGDVSITACVHQLGISYSIAPITNADHYVWTLPANATLIGNADTTDIVVDYGAFGGSGTISVAGTNSCGTGPSSSLINNFTGIPIAEICYITVDSATQKGVIKWQRPLESYADSIVIFRKNTSTLQYDKIATLANVQGTDFTDTASKPNIKSETYKIAVKDSCGYVGDSSAAITHKTIYLYGFLNWGNIPKLYWNDYQGITDPNRFYTVYRDETGVGPFQILKDSIFSFQALNCIDTSQNAATCGNCRYYVELNYTSSCNPNQKVMTGLSTTRSNIKNRSAFIPDAIAENNQINNSNLVRVFPNPANSELNFQSKIAFKNCAVQLIDNMGKVTLIKNYSNTLAEKSYTLNVAALRAGFYTLFIQSDQQNYYQKVVIR